MISVEHNIRIFKENLCELIKQRTEINNEILRLEGSIRVMTDMEKVGVVNIPIQKNPLETTEVIDTNDVQSGGPGTAQEND